MPIFIVFEMFLFCLCSIFVSNPELLFILRIAVKKKILNFKLFIKQ